jgi:hypothetical protein
MTSIDNLLTKKYKFYGFAYELKEDSKFKTAKQIR